MITLVTKDESALRIDERGRWHHRGEPVSNPKIARFFHHAIRKDETGQYYLYNDHDGHQEHVYFEIDDTVYFVLDLEIQTDPLVIVAHLNTDDFIDLDCRTLQQDERGMVYAWVKDSDRARLSDRALHQLAQYVLEDEHGFYLPCKEQRVYIGRIHTTMR